VRIQIGDDFRFCLEAVAPLARSSCFYALSLPVPKREQDHAVARIVTRVLEVRLRLTLPERRHAAAAVERSWRPTVPRPDR